MAVRLLDHPLAGHLLATLRDKSTDPASFRHAARILSSLLFLEATRHLPTRRQTVETPLEPTECPVLEGGLAVVPILRAGLSMLDAALQLFPDVAVGYVGLERNHETAIAASYYCKLPPMEGRHAFVVDPMLATGGSAIQAVSLVKEKNPGSVHLVTVVSAPEGIEAMATAHPDVPITSAALDRGLNKMRYILPGLGDYGDRLYGTF